MFLVKTKKVRRFKSRHFVFVFFLFLFLFLFLYFSGSLKRQKRSLCNIIYFLFFVFLAHTNKNRMGPPKGEEGRREERGGGGEKRRKGGREIGKEGRKRGEKGRALFVEPGVA